MKETSVAPIYFQKNFQYEKPGMLPVETMPETAVAYELYYAKNECVELFRNESKGKKFVFCAKGW